MSGSPGSAAVHIRVARSLALEAKDVHLNSPGPLRDPTPASNHPSCGFALILYVLASFAVAAFFIQGGGLVDTQRTLAPASRFLANARLGVAVAAAAAAGRPPPAGAGAGEEAYQPPTGELQLIAEVT